MLLSHETKQHLLQFCTICANNLENIFIKNFIIFIKYSDFAHGNKYSVPHPHTKKIYTPSYWRMGKNILTAFNQEESPLNERCSKQNLSPTMDRLVIIISYHSKPFDKWRTHGINQIYLIYQAVHGMTGTTEIEDSCFTYRTDPKACTSIQHAITHVNQYQSGPWFSTAKCKQQFSP